MKRPAILPWIFLATSLYLATTCKAEIPVEPYSSKPTAEEMAFVTRWETVSSGAREGRLGTLRCRSALLVPMRPAEQPRMGQNRNGENRIGRVARRPNPNAFVDLERRPDLARVRDETDRIPGVSRFPVDCACPETTGRPIRRKCMISGESIPVGTRRMGRCRFCTAASDRPAMKTIFNSAARSCTARCGTKRRRIAMDTPTNAAWAQAHSYLIPTDKRSSAIWLPLFNYQTGGDGLITGLGWSGAWRAYFDHQGGGKSTILAGVENFDSILHPGETVRSTLNLALYWKGEMLHVPKHVPPTGSPALFAAYRRKTGRAADFRNRLGRRSVEGASRNYREDQRV